MKPKIILTTISVAAIICLSVLIYSVLTRINISTPKIIKQAVSTTPGYYKVTSIADGDTFSVDMDGREERVRMIGIDTPETHKPNSPVECYGENASNFTHNLLDGKIVRLEADQTNQNRDRYGRLLRYTYLPDGSLVNAEVVKQGYGFAYVSFPFTKMEEFKQYQKQASANNIGLWAPGICQIQDQNGRYKTNAL
jgi:micrococcal nuclease